MLELLSTIPSIVTFATVGWWAYIDRKRHKFLSNEITRLNRDIISLKRSQAIYITKKFKLLESEFWRRYNREMKVKKK